LEYIKIRGAREHNLKNINVDIPRNKITVITGLSGSGKSSLAFDTIFAEGQRRYIESLSSYARQFLVNLDKPDVDSIEGLSPSISVDQKTFLRNPRSTVGTITDIYDYLRLLFASIGKVHCYECKTEITVQNLNEMTQIALNTKDDPILYIYSPIIQGRKGEYRKEIEEIRSQGFIKLRIDGRLYDLDEEIGLEKNKKHTLELLIDVIDKRESNCKENIKEAIKESIKRSSGTVLIETKDGKQILLNEKFSCPNCGISYPEISPRLFSFNSPYGTCSECGGLGTKTFFDPDLIIESMDKSIAEGTIKPWKNSRYFTEIISEVADHYNFSLQTPLKKIPEQTLNIILYGTDNNKTKLQSVPSSSVDQYKDSFPGVIGMLSTWYEETGSHEVKNTLSKYITSCVCNRCKGSRLKKESLSVLIDSNNIYDITTYSINECRVFFENLKLSGREKTIGERIVVEIIERLSFLSQVGLNYLSLNRSAPTLSGGEAQRIRLASQVGSNLTGITYVLDEPTIGLHHRDNKLLLETLRKLRDKGNTIIVVEHDENTIRNSDHLIDMGKGAGEKGGNIVYDGATKDIYSNSSSLTAKFLSGITKIEIPGQRRQPQNEIIIKNAYENNLKLDEISIPLGIFVCVTGVSGSGKSTLINDILYKALSKHLYNNSNKAGLYEEIIGIENIKRVINVDQSPIGRTPRSNPVTYTGLFTTIRSLFAMLPESRMMGYTPGRFSFNVSGGRCEKCRGGGSVKIDMNFLSDVYVKCDLCNCRRYNEETLKIKYRGKNISDVLQMTVKEALEFFGNIPKLNYGFEILNKVGLEYIRLGQPATTLSGGEAQRIKLAKEISKRSSRQTLYILDEPTIGLHFEDIKRLLLILHDLVDKGNTVIVIEHNMEIIKCADYIIDLGPEGGGSGGNLVAKGTPEEICKSKNSHTAFYLRKILNSINN